MGPPGDLQVQFGIRNAHTLPESFLRVCSVANRTWCKISTLGFIQSLRDISDSLNHFPDSQIVSAPTTSLLRFRRGDRRQSIAAYSGPGFHTHGHHLLLR
jgi:hypothetical protein